MEQNLGGVPDSETECCRASVHTRNAAFEAVSATEQNCMLCSNVESGTFVSDRFFNGPSQV